MPTMFLQRLLCLTLVTAPLLSISCSSDKKDPPAEEEGTPTGATCPSNSTVTYDGFIKGFMQSYCTRCHSSTLMGDARQGAPLGHDFDSEAGILLVGEHVDEHAGSGPNATNEIMPPDGAKPTKEEREKLSEWLACNVDPSKPEP